MWDNLISTLAKGFGRVAPTVRDATAEAATNPLMNVANMAAPTADVATDAASHASTLEDLLKYTQMGSAGMGMGMSVYQMLEARKKQNAEKINRNPLVTRWT